MFAEKHIPYSQTRLFSRIALDYLEGASQLKPFYKFQSSLEGIDGAIKAKQQQKIDRQLLAETLREQYGSLKLKDAVKVNLELLHDPNTFTITTAHQPNLFTGPLYFIYKILHVIKLAAHLKQSRPDYNFVPVYYMGSEDADFAELNHTYVDGKKIEWKKEQKGAVGRMVVDKTLIQLIDELEGQLSQEAFGNEVIGLLRKSYSPAKTIQEATFELVDELYGDYGLLVLIPDHPKLKAVMKPVFLDELFHNNSASIVQKSSAELEKNYPVQANPRDINLFYLRDDIRERIIREGDDFLVHNTEIRFSSEEIKKELEEHPERFSPNVILRGLYQETILPNLVFVGGGGELAYWLQLKELFEHYRVVYPMLVVRNSFLIVENKWKEKIDKLRIELPDLFSPATDLMKEIVKRDSLNAVSLNGNFEKAEALFELIRSQAAAIDQTLSAHVESLKTRSLKNLQELEKKMFRAEKRKFSDQQRQIEQLKEVLFPNNGLQERVENFSGFYAKWGREFIEELYKHSLTLEQQFTILVQGSNSL